MVMAGAGGVSHQELCDLTSKHFGKIGHTYDAEIPLDLNCRYTGNRLCLLLDYGIGWNLYEFTLTVEPLTCSEFDL